jgi:hypothetical protein
VSSTPLGRQLPRGWRRIADRLAEDEVGGERWSDLEMWGFVTLTITPSEIVGRWFGVDAREEHAPAELAATWAVDAGSAGEVRRIGPLHEVSADRDTRRPLRRWLAIVAVGAAVTGACAGLYRWARRG